MELPVRFTSPALFIAVLALMPGCGGIPSQNVTPTAMAQGATRARSAQQPRSWMLPEAKRDDLLYATDVAGFVHVFSYPAGKEVGTIALGGEPMGMCVDKAGDVWATRFRMRYNSSVVEYAHGGTTIIGSVSTYPYSPWSCSVDPTTGNLAVTNTESGIGVYAHAAGNPTLYTVQGDDYGFTFCTYDESGNLYATAPYSNIAELPKGSSEMANMQLGFSINPWSIQWDEQDKYLAVAGFRQKGQPTPIYHVSVSGTTGSLVGTTLLRRSKNFYPPQYWIEGAKVLGATLGDGPYGQIEDRIESWPYSAGGRPRQFAQVAKDNHPDIYGIIVSRAR